MKSRSLFVYCILLFYTMAVSVSYAAILSKEFEMAPKSLSTMIIHKEPNVQYLLQRLSDETVRNVVVKVDWDESSGLAAPAVVFDPETGSSQVVVTKTGTIPDLGESSHIITSPLIDNSDPPIIFNYGNKNSVPMIGAALVAAVSVVVLSSNGKMHALLFTLVAISALAVFTPLLNAEPETIVTVNFPHDLRFGITSETASTIVIGVEIRTVTKVFQNGKEEYKGQQDITISSLYVEAWKEWNGFTYGGTDTNVQNSTYDSRTLMIFNDLEGQLPEGAYVASASLDITFISWTKGPIVEGHYLTKTWNATSPKLGWRFRNDAKEEWSEWGGLSDVNPDTYFRMDPLPDTGFVTKSVQLDPHVVDSWFRNSSSNNGIILVNKTPIRAYIVPHDSIHPGRRPRLTVNYQFFETKKPTYPLVTGTIPAIFYVQANTTETGCTDFCGDDVNGSGAKNAPYATLKKAIEEAQPNDVILLRAGVHLAGVQVVKPRITIRSHPDEWAVIAAPVNDPNVGIALYLRVDSSGSVIRDVEIVGGHHYAVRIESTQDWGNGRFEGASNILFDNCKIHGSGYNLFKIDSLCENITIQNSELYDAGIRNRVGGNAVALYDTKNVVIRGCYIHDCYGAGIMVKAGARNTLIEKNLIVNTYASGIYVGFYEQSEYMNTRGNNPTYFQAIDTTVRNNIIRKTVGTGIGLYSAKNSTIVFNTLLETAYANQAAILVNAIQTWVSPTYSPLTPCEDVAIVNNIISSASDRLVEIRTVSNWENDVVAGGLIGDMLLANNRYYSNATSNGLFVDQRSATTYLGPLKGWLAQHPETGSSEGPLGLNNIYTPYANSAVVGSGVHLPDVATDYHNRPILKFPVSIGAVQYIQNDAHVPVMKRFPPLRDLIDIPGFHKKPPAAPKIKLANTYRTVYVSPLGSDTTGNGSISNPYKTFRKATDPGIIKENDEIVLRSGTYVGGIGIATRNVTIRSFEGERATISLPTNDIEKGSLIVLYEPYCTVKDIELVGGYWYGIKVDSNDITIENVTIHHTGSDCLKISPFFQRISVSFSEIYRCGVRSNFNPNNPSDGAASSDAIRSVDNSDLIVRKNYIHDVRGTCIKTQGGGQRQLIEKNLVMNCGGLGVTVGFYEDATWMDPVENPDYFESIDAVVKNNIIVNVQGAGVGIYAAKNPRVLHNTLVNVALTMQVPLLIVASPHQLSAVDTIGQSCQNVTILNNIVQLSEAGISQAIYEIRVKDGDGLLPGSPLNTDYNVFFSNYQNYHGNVQSDLEFIDRRLSSFLRGNFKVWMSGGYDLHSTISDPLFDSDFNVEDKSPAVGLSPLLSDVEDDYFDNPRTGPNTDAGAALHTSIADSQQFPPAAHIVNKIVQETCSPFQNAKSIFVSAQGVDGNNCEGTLASPFNSINRALSVAAPGSTIVLRSGRYNESVTVVTPDITIKTYDSDEERAMIVAPLYTANSLHAVHFTASATGGLIQNIEILGGYFYGVKVDADDVTVDGCVIKACGSQCVQVLKAKRFTLKKSEIYDAGMRDPSNGDGVQTFVAESVIIQDSYIHDVPSDGIKFEAGTTNAVVERSVVSMASRCVLVGGRVDYIPLFNASNVELYESINVIIRNNLIATCQNSGIAVYGGKNAQIIFNTINDAGQSYGSPIDISSSLHRNGVHTAVNNLLVANNVIKLPAISKANMVQINEASTKTAAFTGSFKIDYNVYSHEGQSASFQDLRKSTAFKGGFGLWKTHMNTVFSSVEANSKEADPLLNTDTFVPLANSPLINSGLNSSETIAVKDDFYTNNRTGIDVGAIQHQADITTKAAPFPALLVNVTAQLQSSSVVRYPPTGSHGTWWAPGYTDEVEFNCTIFPADNPWNQDISELPVHPRSDAFINNIPRKFLHADFGTTYDGALSGIPYVIVSKDQPKAGILFKDYKSESDVLPGGYPFPEGSPVEGGPDSDGDRHIIAIDKDNCMLYETWRTFLIERQYRETTGQGNVFSADCGAVFDLKTNAMRPTGWTSADAAGLPIFPGLVRYDEVVIKKEVKHAIRFTINRSQKAYIKPALHFASADTNPNIMPMGLRVRMKPNFDCSPYSEEIQVLCAAFKRYGLIMADNGSDWYVSGAPHPLWNDNRLNDLKKIPSSAFEAVYTGKTCLDPECLTTRD